MKISSGNFVIRFRYETGPFTVHQRKSKKGVVKFQGYTVQRRVVCTISYEPGLPASPALLTTGYSYCSNADLFDSETGRQVALNRALTATDENADGTKSHVLPGDILGHLKLAYIRRQGGKPWNIDRQGHPRSVRAAKRA
jgi:hypothetical protein